MVAPGRPTAPPMMPDAHPDHLRRRLPEGAYPVVLDWLQHNRVAVRVSAPRRSKLGDYRGPAAGRPARISVNGDLNPYAFLVTLVHEFAHHAVFERHGRRALPHGAEWKGEYAGLMAPYLTPVVLPADVVAVLRGHLTDAPASSCADPALVRVLRRYDERPLPVLEDLAERTVFRFGDRLYVKGPVRRSRVACRCLNDRRTYVIDRLAGVQVEAPLHTRPDRPVNETTK